MGAWAFFGGFAAVALGIWIIYRIVRGRIRRFSRNIFGTGDILSALEGVDSIENQSPRSLNGCDSLLLPKIRGDFPDFDETLMKTYAADALRKHCSGLNDFTIYNVVISQYLPSRLHKTIILQAAASHTENGQLIQKRYGMHYTYLVQTGDETIAANCPNCGGALGYGVTVCPYCDSRVANVMGNTWQFTEIKED